MIDLREVRENLMETALRQHTTDRRETYSDGFQQGLIFAVTKIDAVLMETEHTDIERIRKIRETRGVGLIEAKEIARREKLVVDIQKAQTVGDLKAVLLRMVLK